MSNAARENTHSLRNERLHWEGHTTTVRSDHQEGEGRSKLANNHWGHGESGQRTPQASVTADGRTDT